MSRGYAEGLPSQDEYRPDTLGDAAIRAGDPEQQYPEYGLEAVPVEYRTPVFDNDGDLTGHEWEDTGRRLVRRNGDFVADVSERHKLVPNERVVAAANQAAKDLGARPFHEFSGDWYIPLDDHVYQDKDRHRVHALYAWDDPVDLGGGDTIQVGFAVHNSIDASLSFEVGLFTFRHACANMVQMGVGGEGMNFDDREVLAHTKKAHTSSLSVEPEELKDTIEAVLTLADDVCETYRAWRDQMVDPQQVEGLIDRLPAKDIPEWMQRVEDALEAARRQKAIEAADNITSDLEPEELEDDPIEVGDVTEDMVEPSPEEKASIVSEYQPDDESAWETYNSITEAVWHDDATSDQTKRRKFRKLHREMRPAENVR